MRKTIATLALAILAAGCSKEITPEEARNAIPEASAIRIDTPKDSADVAATTSATVFAATAEGTPDRSYDWMFPALTTSDYARWSYVTAWTVNGGTWWTLATLRFITVFPPTACAEDTCTWGPWDEDSKVTTGLKVKRWQLVVKKVEEGKFEYALSGMNLVEPGPFLPIVSGVAEPSRPGRGKGHLTVSFDNARQLPESEDDYGTLALSYDTTGPAKIDATLVGGIDKDSLNPINAAYSFVATASGGDLQVAFEGVDAATLNPVGLSLHTRWDATGAGRGDARVFAQDVGGSWSFDYGASECWAGKAGSYALTFDTDPVFGDVTACAAAFQGEPRYSTLDVP